MNEGESTPDAGCDVSRFQLMLGKCGSGKVCTLGSVISVLKENDDRTDDCLLVIVLTKNVVLSAHGPTLHSSKEGQNIPEKMHTTS